MSRLKDMIKNPTATELDLIARYGARPEDARRTRAFEAFAATGLPSRRLEAWKWTDIKARMTVPQAGRGMREDPFSALDGHVIRFSQGYVTGLEGLPAGVQVHAKSTGHALADAEALPLGALTAALTETTLFFEVTETPAVPLRLVFEGEGELALARAVFLLRPGTSLTLLESHVGGAGFNSALLTFTLGAEAHLSRTLVQPSAVGEGVAVTADIQLDAAAEYTQTALAFGGDVTRIETRLTHRETGASATLNGAYLAGPDHHVDFTSHIRHGAERCVTEQRTKGAVRKGGEGVFQGKFLVPRTLGQYTQADMQHNALLLEDGAVVNAKPELEIYADDVECAHGNTCGALDDEALFYMRQRGIAEREAKALLTEAFIAEALATAGSEDVVSTLLQSARAWLAKASD